MSVLGKVAGFVFSRWGILTGLGATGVAYHQSNEELKKDMADGVLNDPTNGAFKRSVDGFVKDTVLPLAKDGVQGLSSLTATTIGTATGIVSAGAERAPNVAEQAANLIGETSAAGKEASDNFFKKFVPKGWEGWATTAALAVSGLLVMQQGYLGDGLKNASGKLLGAPMNLATAALGLAGQVFAAALAAGWLLLTQNGRQLMSDVYQSVRSLFPGAPVKETIIEHPHSLAPAVVVPEPKVVVPERMPDVSSIPLNIRGGDTVTVAPTRSSLGSDSALNPRRDVKNTPNVSMSS